MQNNLELPKLPFPLREYQTEGVKFLINQRNILLADEMGLGKTIQTIVAIRLLLSNKEIKNCLIIVPVSLMSNWIYEFKVWGSILKPRPITGTQKKRKVVYKMNNPVQIASYESIRNDIDFLIENKSYDLVIIDEAQRIKNDSSQISKVIKKIPRKYYGH